MTKVKVKDLPPGRLVSVDPQATVAEVARLMRVDDRDSVAVMSKGRLLGIVTERDLVQAIADGVNPQQTKAEVIMSADPATVSDDEDVAVVAVKMVRLGIRHLPVV
ncbi:MAG TPA: CBS domain-containing protein, partial [Candidatus Dormibacteraeota bacterium]|nr:CBS domain-containing protein [Candidatus Dormibacteraeota bacterium]